MAKNPKEIIFSSRSPSNRNFLVLYSLCSFFGLKVTAKTIFFDSFYGQAKTLFGCACIHPKPYVLKCIRVELN
jgi:hypothetical protein